MTPSAVEVVVVGGGIAGASLGAVLARAGIEVLVVEREARFRDRVRGDGIFPWGVVELTQLGLVDVLPASGARPLPIWQEHEDRTPKQPYDWRSDVPSGDVPCGLNHPGLQETLFAAAAEAGAHTVRPAKVVATTPMRAGLRSVTIEMPTGEIQGRARLVVGADGRESGVRRWIGAQSIADPTHHVIGGCLVDAIDLDPDAAHLAWYPGGISLFFCRADGQARAYVICQPESAEAMRGRNAAAPFLATCAAAFPDGAFAHARTVGPVAFFPGVDSYPDRIAGDGIVLIGD